MNTANESFRMAIQSIWQNKIRAALTMLGIIIGVGAVIGLISLGRGVEAYIQDEFNSMGANILRISSKIPDDETVERVEPLTTIDLEELNNPQNVPSVRQTGAIYNLSGTIVVEGEGVSTSVRGVTPNMAEMLNWEPMRGAYISEEDVEFMRRVAVLGYDLVEDLWDDENYNPVGEVVRINNRPFTVIGVLELRDGPPLTGDNTAVIVPISTAQTKLSDAHVRGGYEVTTLLAQAHSEDVAFDAEDEIYEYFRSSRDIPSPLQDDFEVNNQASLLDAISSITAVLTIFLSIIASVSLLVGGIGIMNIMLVTVTERTQEIGIRKAVGARPLDILVQFLFESVMLSLIGGILGIMVGWLIAFIGTVSVAQLTLSIQLDAILLATIVSSAIGIGFGIFPARQAALMHPIDALRTE